MHNTVNTVNSKQLLHTYTRKIQRYVLNEFNFIVFIVSYTNSSIVSLVFRTVSSWKNNDNMWTRILWYSAEFLFVQILYVCLFMQVIDSNLFITQIYYFVHRHCSNPIWRIFVKTSILFNQQHKVNSFVTHRGYMYIARVTTAWRLEADTRHWSTLPSCSVYAAQQTCCRRFLSTALFKIIIAVVINASRTQQMFLP